MTAPAPSQPTGKPARIPRARAVIVRATKPTKHRRRSLFVSAILWFAAIPPIALCASVLAPAASYHLDIAANLAAQWALLAIAWALVALLFRRGLLALLCLFAAALPIWTLAQDRAAILSLPEVDAAAQPADRHARALIRVLHFNASAGQSDDRILNDLDRYQPDIIAITEPSGLLWRERAHLIPSTPAQAPPAEAPNADAPNSELPPDQPRNDALGRVAFWADAERTMLMGSGLLASRWPMTAWDIAEFGDAARRVIAGRVESPHGPFIVLAAHPRSPRDETRWRFGNDDVEVVAQAARKAESLGLPVIVLADLNATPSGARSRRLAESGLRRTKPLLKPLGTWPTQAVPGVKGAIGRWPLSIAIDDALVSRHWSVRAWSRGESRGSDHWPILADLHLAPHP